MKMPVVSFAPMAMNESVCSTCCYRVTVAQSTTNYYWEVLHGGWIGQRSTNQAAWREEVDANWAEFPFDVDFSANEGMIAIPFFNQEKNEWWVQYGVPDDPMAEISLDEFISGDNAIAQKVNEDCFHMDSQCLYIAVGAPPSYSEHIDSTSPHVTAAGFHRMPHRALQFHS